ncbi:MAG: class II aldolase/adducin family protein [Candidatus Hydrogenedentes bacterium]|nr:class II aldolase/adducin family protein [Candidatus Hydrogenedentota bacterium]
MTELELRKVICEAGRRLYEKNLVAATDGNISARLAPNRYLCTPSGVSKGYMHPRDLVIADGKGNKIAGEGRVTSEFFTHLAAYEERPEMSAVVHAHPPKAIGFTLAGVSLADCVLPEVVYTIGGVPTTEYATPATPEGGKVIRELIRQCDAVLMDRHGALTIGVSVIDALHKMEKIEHAAETLLTAHLLGKVRRLERDEVQKLYQVRDAYGVSGRAFKCAECGCTEPTRESSSSSDALDCAVAETLDVLGRG